MATVRTARTYQRVVLHCVDWRDYQAIGRVPGGSAGFADYLRPGCAGD